MVVRVPLGTVSPSVDMALAANNLFRVIVNMARSKVNTVVEIPVDVVLSAKAKAAHVGATGPKDGAKVRASPRPNKIGKHRPHKGRSARSPANELISVKVGWLVI